MSWTTPISAGPAAILYGELTMLVELAVRNLGVISDARVPFGEGLVALTGETGAGKTMIVEALNLLSGGRPDPSRVRAGADEAVVEGLFAVGDTEWVLRRHVPARGRSRAYVNGELTTAAALGELGASLIELHGQHDQQALTRPRTQRDALDRFAGVDRAPLRAARRQVEQLEARRDALGGDERARNREIDLLRFQIDEIDAVDPHPEEDERLEAEQSLLADALAHRDAGARSIERLSADGGAADLLAAVAGELEGRAPFAGVHERLVALGLDLADCASELRSVAEGIEPDPERLAAITERRQRLVELRRKYGERIEDVLEFRAEAAARLDELGSLEQSRSAVEDELERARSELAERAERVGAQRRAAAPSLAERIGSHLAALALPEARLEVHLSDTAELPGAAEDVQLMIAVNRGSVPGPVSKVASGGELSRVMLALRLVLSEGPPTMVFDEVDAGVGGEAAVAVGRALCELGRSRQVLVVTHLAQVAAFADAQVRLDKQLVGDQTLTTASALDDDGRVVELARMLAGQPDSATAQEHAAELLRSAHAARSGVGRSGTGRT